MDSLMQAERSHDAPHFTRMSRDFDRAEIADSEFCRIFPALMRDQTLVWEAIESRSAALPALLLAVEAIATADDSDITDSALRRATDALKRLREEIAAYIDPIAQRRADRIADDYWGDDE